MFLRGLAITLFALSSLAAFAETPDVDRASAQLRCESFSDQYRNCAVNAYLYDVRIDTRLSNSSCIEGRSWGWTQNSVWVDRGCRAIFRVYYNGGGSSTQSSQFRCKSSGYRYNECYVGFTITNASLVRRFSNSSCSRGSSWGVGRDFIWVDRGCEADFRVYGY